MGAELSRARTEVLQGYGLQEHEHKVTGASGLTVQVGLCIIIKNGLTVQI